MSDDRPGIEFVEPDDVRDGDPDLLDTAPQRRPGTIWIVVGVLAVIVLAAVTVVGFRHASTAGHLSGETVTPRPTVPPVPPVLVPTTTPTASVRQWEGVAGTTARSVCAPCAVSEAPAGVQVTVRRALRTVSRLSAVVLDGHAALIVSALLTNGVELVAVLTPASVEPDPTTFGIPPPLGVQSQRNGNDRLVVVIGGNVDAVALLGRPAVQHWLATLHR